MLSEILSVLRDQAPARQVARRMGAILVLALAICAGVASADQAPGDVAREGLLFALVGFAGSLMGAGAAVAAAWGAQRQIVRQLEGQVAALFRKFEIEAEQRAQIRERLARLEQGHL